MYAMSQAAERDIPELALFLVREFSGIVETLEPKTLTEALTHFLRRFPTQVVICARHQDVIVGIITISIRTNLSLKGPVAEIRDLVVAGSQQTRNLHHRLLKEAIVLSRERKCKQLELCPVSKLFQRSTSYEVCFQNTQLIPFTLHFGHHTPGTKTEEICLLSVR